MPGVPSPAAVPDADRGIDAHGAKGHAMTVYFDRSKIQSSAYPAMLAIGDSWFWYPFVSNLLAEISALVKPDYSNIFALGKVGATMQEYAAGKYAPEFARELKAVNFQYYSAVLISGAGNDAVDWGLCLKPDCTGIALPAQCLDGQRLDDLMDDLSGWLLAMINEVRLAADRVNRAVDVFVHCYDFAPPDGVPVSIPWLGVPLLGPWLKPALDAASVDPDPAFRFEVIKVLITELQQTFAHFDSPRDGIYVVQSAGTLDPAADWANELHPNGQGFHRLVHGPWRKRLQDAGYV
jgi:hypothetical protein